MASVAPAEKIVKILFVGDSGVGKTSLFLRYVDGVEPSDGSTQASVNVDTKHKVIDLEVTKKKIERVRLQVHDTIGQERFGALTSSLYRGAHGAIICYDITDQESFSHLASWKAEIGKYAPKDCVCILVGTKADLEPRRVVAEDAGKATADSWHTAFFEVSAKTNKNVDDAVEELVRRAIQNNKTIGQPTDKRRAPVVITPNPPKSRPCIIL